MTRNLLLTLAAPLVLVVYALALAVIIVGGVLVLMFPDVDDVPEWVA